MSTVLPALITNSRVSPVDREVGCDYSDALIGRTDKEKKQVLDLLQRWTASIELVYRWYSTHGALDINDTSTMSLPQFQQLIADCKISDRQLPLSTTEQIFEESISVDSSLGLKSVLLFANFRAALVRLAMALPGMDRAATPESRLQHLLKNHIQKWSCKVVPGMFRDLLYTSDIRLMFFQKQAWLAQTLKLGAAASPAKAATIDARNEILNEHHEHPELELSDVLDMLKNAKVVAVDGEESGTLMMKQCFDLLSAPSIDCFDPTTFLDFGKVPPPPLSEEEKARLEAKNMKKSARRQSTERLTSAGSRRSSVLIKEPDNQTPTRRASRMESPSPVKEEQSPSRRASSVSQSVSRKGSMIMVEEARNLSGSELHTLEDIEEMDGELDEEGHEEQILPVSGLEGAVLCSAEIPPGQQYVMNTRITTMELFESLARVAYHTAQSRIAEQAGDQFNSRDFLVPCRDLQDHLESVIQQVTKSMEHKVQDYESTLVQERNKAIREKELAAGALTDQQIQEVKSMHHILDEDQNGTLEKEELLACCDDKNGKLFDKLDVDSNGHVDMEEFVRYFYQMSLDRGQKAVCGLISHLKKGIEKRLGKMP